MREGLRPGAGEPARSISRETALALLARSIDMGHGRLAVIRLAMAVHVGARVPQQHWEYCSQIAGACGDSKLQDIYRTAASDIDSPEMSNV
jgi:hypothetical protein